MKDLAAAARMVLETFDANLDDNPVHIKDAIVELRLALKHWDELTIPVFLKREKPKPKDTDGLEEIL